MVKSEPMSKGLSCTFLNLKSYHLSWVWVSLSRYPSTGSTPQGSNFELICPPSRDWHSALNPRIPKQMPCYLLISVFSFTDPEPYTFVLSHLLGHPMVPDSNWWTCILSGHHIILYGFDFLLGPVAWLYNALGLLSFSLVGLFLTLSSSHSASSNCS